jgi:thiamine-monophosphate kinase
VNETALVRRLAAKARPRNPRLIEGIGDDCAVWRPAKGEDLVFTTDFLIEGVHFTRDTYSAADIGHKTLARGLSDIAAMGAAPRFCLLSLALAPDCDARWVDSFYSGLLKLAGRFEVDLAGGDLAHAERVLCDIVACGALPQGRALRRQGARLDDVIYVSGRLGRDWREYRRPVPRIELGLELRGRATACMDLTDGLSLDLHRLCAASGVAASLEYVPVRQGFTIEQALNGGEDYELLWTMPPRRTPPPGAIRIGTISAGPPGLVQLSGVRLPVRGYDHFHQ